MKKKKRSQETGLPAKPKMANFSCSPDEKYISFTNTTQDGVELWLVDVSNANAKKLTNAIINANMGRSVVWARDSKSLLIKALPADRGNIIDTEVQVTNGTIITIRDVE